MKHKDKEEGTKYKRKEEEKLHLLKTPLLEQSHLKSRRFLRRNL
jgi:hypothetical protein